MITTGEPFHQGSFGPVITTGEPSYPDSGRKQQFTTTFPTPGTTSAAVATGAFQPQQGPSPTPGFNALELMCDKCCCCTSLLGLPTPGPTYGSIHCIFTEVGNYQNQIFDWGVGYPAQVSSPLLRGSGGSAVAPASSSGDHQNARGMVQLTT